MGNVTLKKAEEVVDLGIKISSKSLLKPAMDHAIAKGTHAAINTRKYLKNADFDTRVQVWNAYVMPHIEYGAEIWAPKEEKELLKLNKPYKEFFTLITPPIDSIMPFTPSQRVILMELLMLFDYNNTKEALMSDLFFDPANAPQITRSVTSNQLKPLKTISAKTPLLLMKRLSNWNTIPLAVREGTRISFKTYLETILLSKVSGEYLREKLRNGTLYTNWSYLWKLRQ